MHFSFNPVCSFPDLQFSSEPRQTGVDVSLLMYNSLYIQANIKLSTVNLFEGIYLRRRRSTLFSPPKGKSLTRSRGGRGPG